MVYKPTRAVTNIPIHFTLSDAVRIGSALAEFPDDEAKIGHSPRYATDGRAGKGEPDPPVDGERVTLLVVKAS